MQARKLSGYAAIILIAWNPITWLAGAAGLTGAVRAVLGPSSWAARVLFWTHLDVVFSSVGLCVFAFLVRRPLADRRIASELYREATWALTHLRERQVTDAAEEAELHRDYGRWHQRVEDRITRFEHRFSTEYSAFMTLGDDFSVDVLSGITLEHSTLHSMIELKVGRLRSLAQAVQGGGWLD